MKAKTAKMVDFGEALTRITHRREWEMRKTKQSFNVWIGKTGLALMLSIALLEMSVPVFADGDFVNRTAWDNQAMNAAYTEILEEYHDFMFYQDSAQQDLGEGKVAIRDIYGDDKPELLFVYREHEGAENLRIYTYHDESGAVVIFDDMICSFAAGGGNYCLYITSDERLMAYCSERDIHFQWGIWDVSQMLGSGRIGNQPTIFQYETDAAVLHCDVEMDAEDQPTIRKRYGQTISQEELDRWAEEMLSTIQTVIFQSDTLEYDNFDGTFIKAGLYDIEPYFQNIPPFTAECMTWKAAKNTLRFG